MSANDDLTLYSSAREFGEIMMTSHAKALYRRARTCQTRKICQILNKESRNWYKNIVLFNEYFFPLEYRKWQLFKFLIYSSAHNGVRSLLQQSTPTHHIQGATVSNDNNQLWWCDAMRDCVEFFGLFDPLESRHFRAIFRPAKRAWKGAPKHRNGPNIACTMPLELISLAFINYMMYRGALRVRAITESLIICDVAWRRNDGFFPSLLWFVSFVLPRVHDSTKIISADRRHSRWSDVQWCIQISRVQRKFRFF
jgi:hypothetical protein